MNRVFLICLLTGCIDGGPANDTDPDAGPLDAARQDGGPDALLDALPDAEVPEDAEVLLDSGPEPPRCEARVSPLDVGPERRKLRVSPSGRMAWLRGSDGLVRATGQGVLEVVSLGERQLDLELTEEGRFVVVRDAGRRAFLSAVDFATGAVQTLPHGARGGFSPAGGAFLVGVGGDGAFLADLDRSEVVLLPGSPACTGDDCILPRRGADGVVYHSWANAPDGASLTLQAWDGQPLPPIELVTIVSGGADSPLIGLQGPPRAEWLDVVVLDAGRARRITDVQRESVRHIEPSPSSTRLAVPEGSAFQAIFDVATGNRLETLDEIDPTRARWMTDDFLLIHRLGAGADQPHIIRPGRFETGWAVSTQGATVTDLGPGRIAWASIDDTEGPEGYTARFLVLDVAVGEVERVEIALDLPAAPAVLLARTPQVTAGLLADQRMFVANLLTGEVAVIDQRPESLDLSDERVLWLTDGVLSTLRLGEAPQVHATDVGEWSPQVVGACPSLAFIRCGDAPCEGDPGVFRLDW